MADTKQRNAASRLYLLSAVLIFALTAVSRGVSIVNSFVSTDIRYLETVLPTVLEYLRKGFSVAAFGAGIAAAVTAVFRFGEKASAAVFGIHAGVLAADALAAFLIDALSGAASGAMVPLAGLAVLGDLLWSVLIAFLCRWAACRCCRKKKTAERAVLLTSLVHMAGRLFLETVYLIQFLIDVDFLPYAREIVTMAGGYLQIIFFHGGLTWIAAWLFSWVLDRAFSKK